MSDKKYWDETYYRNLKESEKDFLNDMWMIKYKDIICNINNKNAIDLGCGLGQDSIWLMKNGFNVISCDFSKKALNKFKEIFITEREELVKKASIRMPYSHFVKIC